MIQAAPGIEVTVVLALPDRATEIAVRSAGRRHRGRRARTVPVWQRAIRRST